MTQRVLIIGGYGNFGSFITRALAKEANIQVIVAGRSVEKAKRLVLELDARNAPEAVGLDISSDIADALETIKPNIVIHTSGPFQAQGYDVAQRIAVIISFHLGDHFLESHFNRLLSAATTAG